jgi:hypothetical protein
MEFQGGRSYMLDQNQFSFTQWQFLVNRPQNDVRLSAVSHTFPELQVDVFWLKYLHMYPKCVQKTVSSFVWFSST